MLRSMRSSSLVVPGRILLLAADPALVAAQLGGETVRWHRGLALRDDISTDEITPAWACYYHDETLGEFVYVGVRCGEQFPLTRGAVRAGGFAVSVSGRRRGKGSSREASPFAERAAGIRLVVAESFERIYRENCQNLGVLTTTDFGMLARLERGDAIPLGEFTAGEGPIARGIVETGGLFPFNQARLRGDVTVPPPAATPRPLTLAEKILARHWVVGAVGPDGVAAVAPGDEGFVRADLRFSHEYVTPMAAMLWREAMGPAARVTDPGSILFFRDHLTFLDAAMPPERRAEGLLDVALALKTQQEAFAAEQGVHLYGELPRGAGAEAICHSKILERHALPGQVVIGTDSHTPHAGAIGCVAFGVGTTAMANAWLTRDARLTVPPTVRVRLHGALPRNVSAKDVMLELLRRPFVRDGGAIGAMLEYTGTALAALDVDERATLTNMAAEIGAFSAIVAPDARTVAFLMRERDMTAAEATAACAGLTSDDDAAVAATLDVDCAALRPMVALPGDPGFGLPLGGPDTADVLVDIAYAGSCTAGKKADMDMYAAVFREAAARGERVHPRVRCYVQFGSQAVRRYAAEQGYLALFEAVGAAVLEPSCGACINAGPGVSDRAETVTVSAINRNFPGRSGPGKVYLASPFTVAASALAGRLTAWEPPSPSCG